ncbi:MAG: methyl-accepting chemotaxis protein [Elusimicrobia bacterium]|nr:methyl-accepting chemotaxis protein [Elusimicrobiota bacterium]
MKKNLRRQMIVKKELQLKLAAIQAFSMILVALTCLITYRMLINYLEINLPPSVELVDFISNISRTLAMQLIVLLVIGILISILVSHRIVGPVYRLEKDIEAVISDIDKNVSLRVKVRKGDEILSLVDAVNKLLDKLEKIYTQKQLLIHTLENRIKAIKEIVGENPEILKHLVDIEKAIIENN